MDNKETLLIFKNYPAFQKNLEKMIDLAREIEDCLCEEVVESTEISAAAALYILNGCAYETPIIDAMMVSAALECWHNHDDDFSHLTPTGLQIYQQAQDAIYENTPPELLAVPVLEARLAYLIAKSEYNLGQLAEPARQGNEHEDRTEEYTASLEESLEEINTLLPFVAGTRLHTHASLLAKTMQNKLDQTTASPAIDFNEKAEPLPPATLEELIAQAHSAIPKTVAAKYPLLMQIADDLASLPGTKRVEGFLLERRHDTFALLDEMMIDEDPSKEKQMAAVLLQHHLHHAQITGKYPQDILEVARKLHAAHSGDFFSVGPGGLLLSPDIIVPCDPDALPAYKAEFIIRERNFLTNDKQWKAATTMAGIIERAMKIAAAPTAYPELDHLFTKTANACIKMYQDLRDRNAHKRPVFKMPATPKIKGP